jgi:hypothetical protein
MDVVSDLNSDFIASDVCDGCSCVSSADVAHGLRHRYRVVEFRDQERVTLALVYFSLSCAMCMQSNSKNSFLRASTMSVFVDRSFHPFRINQINHY